MQILVLYTLRQKKVRKTIIEHLYSFKKYAPEHNFIYVNVGPKGVPSYLNKISFHAVILHYTFLAGERFLPGSLWEIKRKGIENLQGFKIAIPQDEYCETGRLVKLFKDISVDVVCTCFYKKEDITFAYGRHLPSTVQYLPVLTGYVDEALVEQIAPLIRPHFERPIDIGYRASMLPAHLGKHGQLKYELIGEFNTRLANSDLNLDIRSSNNTLTNEDKSAVKLGNAWNTFLLDCKAFIGCEGGSSLLDFDGSIQKKVYDYSHEHPEAPFLEIEKACFPGMDYNISCFAISPRHFEAAITKTLQILVEGYYGGIFKADHHYVCLKKDFSNFDDVIETLKDEKKCNSIVERAYEEIVVSGKYTYAHFVDEILSTIKIKPTNLNRFNLQKDKILIKRLFIREIIVDLINKYHFQINPIHFAYRVYVKFLKPYIKKNK